VAELVAGNGGRAPAPWRTVPTPVPRHASDGPG